MKNSMRRAMISTVCMLIVAVMSLTGVTYAWFTAGTQASINGISMEVTSAAGGVEISEDSGTTWKTQLNWTENKTEIDPVSTVDAVNFFSATINKDNTAQIQTTAIVRDSSEDIIKKTIQIRNTGTQQIVVNLDGSVFNKITTVRDTDILKAARVALIVNYPDAMNTAEQNAVQDITYIWTGENDTVTYYGINKATEVKGQVLNPDALVEEQETAAENVYINANEAVEGYTAAVEPTVASACNIVLPGNVTGAADNYTAVEITLVIWIEGQDPDCKNSNAGGAFDVALNFKAAD